MLLHVFITDLKLMFCVRNGRLAAYWETDSDWGSLTRNMLLEVQSRKQEGTCEEGIKKSFDPSGQLGYWTERCCSYIKQDDHSVAEASIVQFVSYSFKISGWLKELDPRIAKANLTPSSDNVALEGESISILRSNT